jgi:hypothetical protein
MISLIPSLQVPGVSIAPRGRPVVTGVPTIEMLAHTFVCTLVYHTSVTPVALGSENLTPVAVCSSAQNGSVPLAMNGVSGTIAGIEITTPVATDTGGVVTGVDSNGFVQLVRNPMVRIAMILRDFCIRVR